MATTKNPTTAAVLGFLLGPLGLLYVSLRHAAIGFACVLGISLLTVGVGTIPIWIACGFYGYMGANSLNAALAQATPSQPHGAPQPHYPPPPVYPPPSYPPQPAYSPSVSGSAGSVSSGKFCAACGTRLALTAKFCTKCGATSS